MSIVVDDKVLGSTSTPGCRRRNAGDGVSCGLAVSEVEAFDYAPALIGLLDRSISSRCKRDQYSLSNSGGDVCDSQVDLGRDTSGGWITDNGGGDSAAWDVGADWSSDGLVGGVDLSRDIDGLSDRQGGHNFNAGGDRRRDDDNGGIGSAHDLDDGRDVSLGRSHDVGGDWDGVGVDGAAIDGRFGSRCNVGPTGDGAGAGGEFDVVVDRAGAGRGRRDVWSDVLDSILLVDIGDDASRRGWNLC